MGNYRVGDIWHCPDGTVRIKIPEDVGTLVGTRGGSDELVFRLSAGGPNIAIGDLVTNDQLTSTHCGTLVRRVRTNDIFFKSVDDWFTCVGQPFDFLSDDWYEVLFVHEEGDV